MKMKSEHFEYLKTAITSHLLKHPDLVNNYEKGLFPRSEKVKDLQVRFNWNLLFNGVDAQWLSDALLYSRESLNDANITTALKRICPKVTRKY